MATVALVDADRQTLTSVNLALETEGFQTQVYDNSAAALAGLRQDPPDLAVLEVVMPGMDGTELFLKLRQHSNMPIIFLTSKDDEIDELFGLKLGAADYIRKPVSPHLLIERVKAVLKRTSRFEMSCTNNDTQNLLSVGKLEMDPLRQSCTWDTRPVSLTATEFLILHSLAERPGVVRPRESLIRAAYDNRTYISERAVDSHVKRLRAKFKLMDAEFNSIETLYGLGYRFNNG